MSTGPKGPTLDPVPKPNPAAVSEEGVPPSIPGAAVLVPPEVGATPQPKSNEGLSTDDDDDEEEEVVVKKEVPAAVATEIEGATPDVEGALQKPPAQPFAPAQQPPAQQVQVSVAAASAAATPVDPTQIEGSANLIAPPPAPKPAALGAQPAAPAPTAPNLEDLKKIRAKISTFEGFNDLIKRPKPEGMHDDAHKQMVDVCISENAKVRAELARDLNITDTNNNDIDAKISGFKGKINDQINALSATATATASTAPATTGPNTTTGPGTPSIPTITVGNGTPAPATGAPTAPGTGSLPTIAVGGTSPTTNPLPLPAPGGPLPTMGVAGGPTVGPTAPDPNKPDPNKLAAAATSLTAGPAGPKTTLKSGAKPTPKKGLEADTNAEEPKKGSGFDLGKEGLNWAEMIKRFLTFFAVIAPSLAKHAVGGALTAVVGVVKLVPGLNQAGQYLAQKTGPYVAAAGEWLNKKINEMIMGKNDPNAKGPKKSWTDFGKDWAKDWGSKENWGVGFTGALKAGVKDIFMGAAEVVASPVLAAVVDPMREARTKDVHDEYTDRQAKVKADAEKAAAASPVAAAPTSTAANPTAAAPTAPVPGTAALAPAFGAAAAAATQAAQPGTNVPASTKAIPGAAGGPLLPAFATDAAAKAAEAAAAKAAAKAAADLAAKAAPAPGVPDPNAAAPAVHKI